VSAGWWWLRRAGSAEVIHLSEIVGCEGMRGDERRRLHCIVRLSLLFSSSLSAIGGGHGWERWPGMVQLASGWVVFELGRDWGKSWTSLL